MKRLWLGLGLLLLLFGVGVAADQLSAHLLEPVCDDLLAASDAALAENWTQAEQLAAQARQQHQDRDPRRERAPQHHDAALGLLGAELRHRRHDDRGYTDSVNSADHPSARSEAAHLKLDLSVESRI